MSRRLPPLNALPDFEAAARLLSFTRAADELHVTHGAVSRQVKSLEDFLGVPLFRRLNRALELTGEGQAYARSVRELLDALAEATRRTRKTRDTRGLTVSTTYSFTSGWLVPRLGRFRAQHPDIDVRLQANDRVIEFERDNVDLAIRYGRGQYSGLAAERLMGDDYAPVGSPVLAQGKRPLKKPGDLRHHVLLHEESNEVDWRMWLMAAGVEGVDASRGPIFSHSTMAIQAAIRGEGVALGRTALIAEELAAGQLVRLFNLRLKAEMAYYVVCPPRALERPVVRAFRDWLIAEAAAADEERNDMLNAYICPQGRMERVAELAADETMQRAVWIDLLSPTADEIGRVQRATGLMVPSEASLSEIESSSRLATREGVLYLSLPLVSLADRAPKGISAGFVLARDRLLTVRFAPSPVVTNFVDRHCADGKVGESSAHIMVGLLEAIIDRQADALEEISAEMETLSHRVFGLGNVATGRNREDAMLRATLAALGRIGDLISHIRETQVAVARIGPYVETVAADWLPAELHPRLATMRSDIASVSDFDTHLNEKLQFLLDATLGFINIAQNNVIKVLTIASVAGIPPVLVAGIYGMNFKGMPEYDWSWGYPFGLAMIVGSGLVALLIFWWRGWL